MDELSEEYSKNVSPTKEGRKFRISKNNKDQVKPKVTRYRKERLGEVDIACNHRQGKRKGVICNAGELTRNEILSKYLFFNG